MDNCGGGGGDPHHVTNLKSGLLEHDATSGRVIPGVSKGRGAFTCTLRELRSVS
jgi:hypothetical protein